MHSWYGFLKQENKQRWGLGSTWDHLPAYYLSPTYKKQLKFGHLREGGGGVQLKFKLLKNSLRDILLLEFRPKKKEKEGGVRKIKTFWGTLSAWVGTFSQKGGLFYWSTLTAIKSRTGRKIALAGYNFILLGKAWDQKVFCIVLYSGSGVWD